MKNFLRYLARDKHKTYEALIRMDALVDSIEEYTKDDFEFIQKTLPKFWEKLVSALNEEVEDF